MAAEVALEGIEVIPVLHERGSRRIGMDSRVKDLRIMEDSSRFEDTEDLPHGFRRIGKMFHHPAEEGSIKAPVGEGEFVGGALHDGHLTRGDLILQQNLCLCDLRG